ncbi:MAG: hypothetical protein ABI893_17520 [Polaromonas sp.]|uniref:hypothetical protein n=1 Tax=Polaromonas sp. TaxID=1869339 RepID=UPI0032662EA9
MIAPLEPNPAVKYIQPKVQRRMGRLLIQIQQYEKLLKTLLVESEIAGTIDSVPASRNARVEKYRAMTLGTLVKETKTTFLRTGPLPDDDDLCPHPSKVVFRARWTIQLTENNAATLEEDLRKLVTLRNDLVHHLIEQFDIFSVEGCRAALSHLEECRQTLDAAYTTLREWAHDLMTAREAMAAPAFRAMLIDHLSNGAPKQVEQSDAKS